MSSSGFDEANISFMILFLEDFSKVINWEESFVRFFFIKLLTL